MSDFMDGLELELGKGGMEDGTGYAVFRGVKPATEGKELTDNKTGQKKILEPGLVWEFEFATGRNKGRTTNYMTGRKPTDRNSCGAVISALTGSYRVGDTVRPKDWLGRKVVITISNGRIASVTPPVDAD